MRYVGTLDGNRRQALEWVNALRTEWGLAPLDELPRGNRNHASGCVLSNALNNRAAFQANGICYPQRDGNLPIKMPEPVATFEMDFERGFYKDLIDGAMPGCTNSLEKTALDSPYVPA